jgi:hypothetical protein
MAYSAQGNKGVLPVPSVFVTNKQGEILFEYINPNYKTRISGSLLLAGYANWQNNERQDKIFSLNEIDILEIT